MMRGTSRAWVVAGTVMFAMATTVVGAVRGAPIHFLVLDALSGMSFLVAGAVAWRRRPHVQTGPLLLLCAVLWFAGSYSPAEIPWVTPLAIAGERYYDLVLAYLALSFPGRHLERASQATLGALAAAMLSRSLARLALFDRNAVTGCTDCAGNPFAVAPNEGLFFAIEIAAGGVIIATSIAVVALVVRRWQTATPVSRRIVGPVVWAGAIASVAAAYWSATLLAPLVIERPLVALAPPWDIVHNWVVFGARALIPLGFLVGTLRLRVSHGPAGRLALELGGGDGTPSHMTAALRHALRDPTITVARWDDQQQSWLDEDGHRIEAPAETDDRAVLLLQREGTPVAAVVHDRVLLEDPGLYASVSAVLRLTTDNERLESQVRRQLAEVQESRARIVAAADGERRRIERDLHDGAQQRLLSVSLALQQAREDAADFADAPQLVERLDELAVELRDAMSEMRELARGIHPQVLTNEGLGPAVRALARRSPVPVDVRLDLNGRLPAAVETAAYYVVAEGLANISRHAHARHATITITRHDRRLVVEVGDDGVGGASVENGSGLRGLSDRVAALNGALQVKDHTPRGTTLIGSIPCES